ncbi:uncharacterized protein KY384_005469 [Bacidia gigantensis]|uniref:uncharacterized protein n=1 Tax=Bacidia gigantensis TaxID=2732470 RepID=UPI001D05833C|nr:uncharacterized protein KY384_005469 [Bacidia gigantensis]KAG8529987.1 hypothetical protein KY384_005469 [Bacidia gigantensis]
MAARCMLRPSTSGYVSLSLSFRRHPLSTAASTQYENILLGTPKPGVALTLFKELNNALKHLDDDNTVGAIVLTGSEKAFAAGADIKEMKNQTFSDVSNSNFIASWSSTIPCIRKPILSAVNGHALGGGCELALMTDIIYCSSTATFGQPEIKLGVIPGAGGSQRLTRIIGKSKAMDLILTGRNFSGIEAEKWGIAAKCFDSAQACVDGALDTAGRIAGLSRVAVRAAKEIVNKSQDLGIREGVEYERKVFHGLFGSRDQKIGMEAFVKKEKPQWAHE